MLASRKDDLSALGVRSIGLFGSAARGEASADSDLDFVVELRSHTFDAYMGVKESLERMFGRRVDLVLKGAIKPALRERIGRETVHAEGF